MKNEKTELNSFSGLKHKANENESYFLTIFEDKGYKTINLNNFGKKYITFGRRSDNDIVLSSRYVDEEQGYLEFTEYGILAVNTSSNVEIVGNNNRIYEDFYLSEGSFIKILPDEGSQSNGVILIMSIGRSSSDWSKYTLKMGAITLGSSNFCNIVLPQNGIKKKHATIRTTINKIYIEDENTLNGIYVNGKNIISQKQCELKNLDVIFIANTKMIIYGKQIIYQVYEKGVRLDAIDIVKKVKIKFKMREISSHINMSIKPAEFVAFVGGSGAGKSTFMKAISGVDRPTQGRVYVDGEDLYENYETIKYNIGYVPQDDIVYSNLTLHDMLNYAAKLRMPEGTSSRGRINRIKEVLEIVQLTDFENSYIRQLSGGQRKRASIAVELIADPNLFFLDEPTSGLDPGTERSIMQTLRGMADMGKTIILVTHNTLNLHLCDKVAFFGNGGKLCFYGSPKEALEFFNVDDFVDIYTLLNENTDRWQRKYKEIEEPVEFVRQEVIKTNVVAKKKKSFLRQLWNLVSRYIKLISNDWLQLLLLFAQSPIIAYLLTLISSNELYKSYDDTKAILFSIGCACIWLGLLNSVQEICKEKVILQKEHMADLKLSAYLLSKFIVQAMLAFIQAFLMVYVFQKIVGKSEYSIILNSFWDIQLICFLTILSSSTLGLFISSLVKNSNIAMSIVPLILVPQLLFSGILFKLEGAAEYISNFILCRWTMEGLGTSVNLNKLTKYIQKFMPTIKIDPENYFLFTQEHMIKVILIISLMTFALLIASYIVLRKNVDKNM